MRKQLSIVLVEGDHVPRELSALLVGMGVWVKSTWSTGLDAALAQTTPHLVVCGDPSQLPLLKRTIAETHPGTPLLLIGDWDLGRAGRAIASGLVEDLIPESLPAADIARRLETLAARRATRTPSRATLTPPTRAGIHPLMPVGTGRDDRTPESRQDHPAPSRRPPPPPVRVMTHAPSWAPASRPPQPHSPASAQSFPREPRVPADLYGSRAPARQLAPAAQAAPHSAPPRPPTRVPARAPSTYPQAAYAQSQPSAPSTYPQAVYAQSQPSAPQRHQPSGPYPGSAVAMTSGAPRSVPPQSMPPGSVPPRAMPHGAMPARAMPHGSVPPQSMPPQSMPPQSMPPYSLAPYSLSPDSAPPIQMVTSTTTTARRSRRKSSGPGFTLGAALGVAASAAAFVGVIEFEQDLRQVAATSAGRITRLMDRPSLRVPAWLAELTGQSKAGPALAQTNAAPTGAAAPPATAAAPAATGAAPLELSDLGSVETDSKLGMSEAEAAALFKVEDKGLPSCDQLLAGWEPPLPMIEEDRPKHGATHRRQAQDYLVAGEPEKALRDLCKSAHIDPAGPGTESLASVYLSLRSLAHAETWIQRFLTENPRSDSGRELLGDIQNQQGKVTAARAVWLDVLGVQSDATGLMREVAKHWVQDAAAAMNARDLAQAERKLRRALTLDPTSPGAALLLSRVLERQDETAASIAWSKRARDL